MNPGINVVVEYLSSVPAWYLATAEGDQPHVRPFSFVAAFSDRIWFCTGAEKDVYRELKVNPKLEASAWKPAHGWLVLRGEADFTDEVNDLIRRAGYAHMRSLGEVYDGVEDPNLVFFSVREPRAWIRDIDGSETEIDFSGAPFEMPPEKEAAESEDELMRSAEAHVDPFPPFDRPEPFEPIEEFETIEAFEPEAPITPGTSTYIVEEAPDDTLQQPEAFYVEPIDRTGTGPS